MDIEQVLVVDDEPLIRSLLEESLSRKGLQVLCAEHGKRALELLEQHQVDLVLTDLQMPVMGGMELIRKMDALPGPKPLVVVSTAYASVENVIEALRLGAFDYLLKPVSPDALQALVDKARSHHRLKQENQFLRQENSTCRTTHQLIAHSAPMRAILSDLESIAQSQASVFIHGESGCGKEVIARELHRRSLRASEPFIRVNCPAIAPSLLESEFFGHEKGAFTGADTKKIGRLELAHKGTVLLDEVTEIPLSLQPKLLRAIQEHEFERVGSSKAIQSDLRFLATSNRNMKEAIAEGVFRKDLYYRLNVIPLEIPPLRARKEDILPLSEHYVDQLCKENHRTKMHFSTKALQKLRDYHWPGNVRELINVIERAVVLKRDLQIAPEHLLLEDNEQQEATTLKEQLDQSARRVILKTLRQVSNQKEAAKLLGITTRTLSKKIEELNVTLE